MRIVLVVGLPASGKTHLARRISEQGGLELLDDPPAGFPLRDFLHSKDSGAVIADPHLCCPKTRAAALDLFEREFPKALVEVFYFENDPAACLDNMRRRQAAGDARQVEDMIRMSSRHYRVPAGAFTLPVWRPSAG